MSVVRQNAAGHGLQFVPWCLDLSDTDTSLRATSAVSTLSVRVNYGKLSAGRLDAAGVYTDWRYCTTSVDVDQSFAEPRVHGEASLTRGGN